MFVRAYLRASTKEQDAERARERLIQFAEGNNQQIASFYVENESGTKLERPELNRLLSDSHPGDIILIESVDRLTRLQREQWELLKQRMGEKRIRVVALDLPTSHRALTQTESDGFTDAMLDAINGMMLDMLAAIALKDYEQRRQRQAEGLKRAKDRGVLTGRKADPKLHAQVEALLEAGKSWNQITELADVSRATVSRIAKKMKKESIQ
ncbi:recombinase family protein [Dongshaea marina]|uniref:recombinase family protein n=1 Tax=Dongshaea marina TaxID=2047966 RepID=UPI000D3E1867|nr:recombinase family protein [Dongshaea marina]